MNRPILFLLVFLFLRTALPADAEPTTHLTEEAAATELRAPDGTTRSLGALRGEKGLLVIFTANTCAYAVDWRDRYPALAEQSAERGIGFALVNSNARKRKSDDSPEAMAAEAAEHFPGIAYWIDVESRLADLLGARRTPEVFLFDADDRLVYHGVIDDHSGPLDRVERHHARDALDALFSGDEMPEATAPLGCSILRPRKRRPEPEP